jgi:serine/threonine protein kinase/Flp pilus assembly protein TadD
MDQDRWSAIKRIFHAALEVEDPGQRHALVAAESKGDTKLQAEVELLLGADADAHSYLESPLVLARSLSSIFSSHASPLAPGDVLCGRFRIVGEIAEGGMGHVFEAFDSELGVPVALKVIRPEIASSNEAITRFRREVRLARSITHPNICRIFDIEREVRDFYGQRVEFTFLTMELLSGETLSRRISRDGPIMLLEALNIARQIAAALNAAHARGIIHRDMKPANIMLVAAESSEFESSRIVVTDFGIAKVDPIAAIGELSSHTKTGHPIGTLAYMAPEQLEGAAVSPATDIYAFGLVLFEMITGRPAFPANNLLEGLAQRMRGSFPSVKSLGKEIPIHWACAIQECLHLEPSARPQDATAVIRMLENRRSFVGHSRLRLAVMFRRPQRRSIQFAEFVLVIVALFLAGLRLYRLRTDLRVTPGSLVYLTQVKNQTSEHSLDSLTELIQAGLSQSIQMDLLDQSRVGDILQQMTRSPEAAIDAVTAREIAMRSGAARVVFVTITGSPGKYSLNVDIQQPDNTPLRYRDHWMKRFTWDGSASTRNAIIPTELLTEVRTASNWIRHEVGESRNDIARLDAPPEDVTTNNWNALSEYIRASHLNREQRPAEAVLALRSAIRIDPQFALAYGMLADIQLTLHHEAEGFDAYKKALDPNLERRLSRRERDRLKGMYAIDSWDFSAAVDAFRDYQTFYPNDKVGWVYPTYPLSMLRRDAEAVANLKRAAVIDPQDPHVKSMLAGEYLIIGDLEHAKLSLAAAQEAAPTGGSIALAGSVAVLEGDLDEAFKLFSSLKTSPEARLRSRSFEMLAALAGEQGEFTKALPILDEGISEDAEQGNTAAQSSKLVSRGWIKARLGDFSGCSSDLRVAVARDPSPQLLLNVETVLGQAIELAPPSVALRLRGQIIEIARDLPSADYGVITRILAMRSQAESMLAEGKINEAISLFRDLAAVDAPAAPREYLGRSLMAAADRLARHEIHSDTEFLLRREAAEAYAVIALHPGIVWQSPYQYPPGFLADELTSYIQSGTLAKISDNELQGARARLSSLHNSKRGFLSSSF